MPWDTDLQYNNQIYDNLNPSSGYENTRFRKLLILMVGILLTIILVVVIVRLSTPESQQSKYIKSATVAARKLIPDAKVTNVKVDGGFAIAIVSDPEAKGQANSGNTTIFKVSKDGSMKLIANSSYFSPLDLLGLGIPLETQAKLTGSNLAQVKQNFANQCGYTNGNIGYTGFEGSFNPGGWEFDSATLRSLEQKLSNAINNLNITKKPDAQIICVNATRKNSNDTTNKTTYISTITLQMQFVSNNGILTTHVVTYAIGPNYYRSYTLDGQNI